MREMLPIRKQQVNDFVMYYLNITCSFPGSLRDVAMVAGGKNQLRSLRRNLRVGSAIASERDAEETDDAGKRTLGKICRFICASFARTLAVIWRAARRFCPADAVCVVIITVAFIRMSFCRVELSSRQRVGGPLADCSCRQFLGAGCSVWVRRVGFVTYRCSADIFPAL